MKRSKILVSVLVFALAACPAFAADFHVPVEGAPKPDQAVADAPATASGEQDISADFKRLISAREGFPAAGYEVEALAGSFNGDAGAAFGWIRDNIRLDPYMGHLRDADGVLAARGGNSLDRAILLKAVLDKMNVKARFAASDALPDEARSKLATAVFATRHAVADPAPAFHAEFLARVQARAARDYDLLSNALGPERIGAMDRSAPAEIAGALAHHVWLQAELNGSWTDLDSSLPDAQPGAPLAAAASTFDEPDKPLDQTVTLSLRTIGSDGETEVLTQTLPADKAAAQQIELSFQPAQEGYAGAVTGDTQVVPVLLVGAQGVTGKPIASGIAATGGLNAAIDALGGDDGAAAATGLKAVTLHVTTQVAGEAPVEIVRILAAAPDGGTMPADAQGPLVWRQLNHIVISTGALSLRDFAGARLIAMDRALTAASQADPFTDATLADAVWPANVGNLVVPAMSERVFAEALNTSGVRAVVTRPRVMIFTSGPGEGGGDRRTFGVDLALDGVTVIAADGHGLARERLWYGVLESALETEYGLLHGLLSEPGTASHASASLAITTGPLTVFDQGHAVPEAATAAMRAQAAAATIVVAGDAAASKIWWTIAADGASRAVTDPSLGNFTWGGNYVNSGGNGAPRYIIDPNTAEEVGQIRDGITRMRSRPPPKPECSGANEYMTILGCVSIPASYTLGQVVTIAVAEVIIIAIIAIARS